MKALVTLEDFSVASSKEDDTVFKLKDSFHYYKENPLQKSAFKFEEWQPEEVCIISYTSGTSGFTKGVLIPERSLVSNIVL